MPVFDEFDRPAHGGNHLAEPVGHPTVAETLKDHIGPVLHALCKARIGQQNPAQSRGDFNQRALRFSGQNAHHLGHFQRVAQTGGKGLVHVGDHGGCLAPRRVGRVGECCGQRARLGRGFHERA